MKSRAYTFFCVLIASVFLQSALAAEAVPAASSTTNPDADAHVKSLQQELSEAKDRVAELEAELSKAQSTIEQMHKNTTVAAQDTEQPAQAVDQTVRGEPLYDVYNPQTPVAQQNVIAEKFTPETQSQAVATTRLLEDDLERSRIRNITRIADQVPNMQYGQSGNEARISIRGMRTNRTGAEADPVVAIFEDGVSVPTTTQALEPYVDINRIEVLRGPQGVMYGRNAFGGVINIISNEPDPSGWDAAFEGEYGYADGTRFDAMLNVPILETLSTRIAARYDMHSGYVGNFVLDGDADDLRDRKQQYVRWMTKWQPSDKFNLMVNLISYDQNQTGSGMWGYQQIGAYVDGEYQTGNLIAPPGARADRDGWNVGRNMASLEDQENLSGTIKLNWNIGFANLEWFINKSTFENQQVFDSDYSDAGDPYNSDFNGWRSKRDTWSSELRLISSSNGRFDWLAGVYWLDMESNWDWLETRDAEFFQPEWDLKGRYKTDNTSVFASAGYNFNDRWRLSGGLRWYKDNKTLRNGEKDSWDGVLWNAALNYKINENIDSYFSASTGYRPGGLNETPGVEASFDSESITAYELGLKSILADGSLVLNLSAFYNDFSDMQAQSFTILPLPGTAGLMDYMSTAGDMESKGVEAEIQWLPGTRWNISANLAWLDAKFKDYEVPGLAGLGYIEGHTMGDTLNLDGWRPALSPEWSFGLQASYIFDVGKGGTLTPMIQTTYVGEQYTNDLNLVGAHQDSYTKTDIRLFWDLPGNKVKLQFYLENIEEEANVNNTMIYNPEERPEIATFLANWGDPMTYGIVMSYKW
ncbi:MAG: TonB-dependent receptor [Xanthomonadales bacterium]|nr:TonB-dependent receptor [Xanthomonadales bacterium]